MPWWVDSLKKGPATTITILEGSCELQLKKGQKEIVLIKLSEWIRLRLRFFVSSHHNNMDNNMIYNPRLP
jgi:hypothetical protein